MYLLKKLYFFNRFPQLFTSLITQNTFKMFYLRAKSYVSVVGFEPTPSRGPGRSDWSEPGRYKTSLLKLVLVRIWTYIKTKQQENQNQPTFIYNMQRPNFNFNLTQRIKWRF